MTFTKRESFGYSLNGKEFQVPEGKPYTSVVDSFDGTTARILAGVNGSTADRLRPAARFTKTVDTGWASPAARDDLTSNILTLWGLARPRHQAAPTADALSDELRPAARVAAPAASASLVTPETTAWVNAVDGNDGGVTHFVSGRGSPPTGSAPTASTLTRAPRGRS